LLARFRPPPRFAGRFEAESVPALFAVDWLLLLLLLLLLLFCLTRLTLDDVLRRRLAGLSDRLALGAAGLDSDRPLLVRLRPIFFW
jgi:hypothetical protein